VTISHDRYGRSLVLEMTDISVRNDGHFRGQVTTSHDRYGRGLAGSIGWVNGQLSEMTAATVISVDVTWDVT
jgi:hypothetical protein